MGGREWSGWRFILKREPPRFVKGFNVLCEKKERAKDDSQVEMSAPVFLTLCLVRIFLLMGIRSSVTFEDTNSFHSLNHHREPCTGSNISIRVVHRRITPAPVKDAEIFKIP